MSGKTVNLEDLKKDLKEKELTPKEREELMEIAGKTFAKDLDEKPEEKKIVLVGFDRIAGDMKKKVEKLARQKGISTFSVMGIPTRNGVPKYSGGMTGNPEILVEGLFNMARQRPEIKALLEITVNALRQTEVLEVTKISELHKLNKVSARLFNSLNNAEIYDLRQLEEKTIDEVLKFKSMGDKSVKDLEKLLTERGLGYKVEKKAK